VKRSQENNANPAGEPVEEEELVDSDESKSGREILVVRPSMRIWLEERWLMKTAYTSFPEVPLFVLRGSAAGFARANLQARRFSVELSEEPRVQDYSSSERASCAWYFLTVGFLIQPMYSIIGYILPVGNEFIVGVKLAKKRKVPFATVDDGQNIGMRVASSVAPLPRNLWTAFLFLASVPRIVFRYFRVSHKNYAALNLDNIQFAFFKIM